ncbi:terpenoid cyclases/protein prenyltransferase alpha-alpha toroid [Artemisia annua]|uniref:Terpenoid cyclases/protein prenyltransferase alpha-alpha toroid n=1 Tax=Artemisia annua TaxID=35608 RepID=A0A2U1QIQ1_ARTAN|nr:terpenoid cyclases/protein prenyltransferase alpha-alpha toroid [Artemisia annua]
MTISSSPSSLDGCESTKQEVIRNTVNFYRSIWGDQFLTFDKELKEKVRKELVITDLIELAQHVKLLELIDAVQRLGVAYHFEEEIEECLKYIYVQYGDQWISNNDLQSTSLWFRLLRQQGFDISSGIFNKYKNTKGDFMESLRDDVRGMLSLYEAAHMRVEGEEDRIVEGYFWILAVYFEPQHSEARIFLLKACSLVIILDDTYDNYGTYEELEVLTQAVQKWSRSCLDMLPEYMKVIYRELLDVHEEAEDLLEKKGKAYRSYYTKEMVKEYTRNLLIEAKWAKEGYIPTVEEHMSVTLVTCAYAMIIAKCYVHGDDSVTEDTFKWVSTYPPLVKASCLILRLMDDIATHKEEQERNHVASSVECYMKQYGVSEEQTHDLFLKQVEDSWKIINQESLRPTDVLRPLLIPPINLARVCDVLYKRGDDYNHVGKEMIHYINSLLVDPISM